MQIMTKNPPSTTQDFKVVLAIGTGYGPMILLVLFSSIKEFQCCQNIPISKLLYLTANLILDTFYPVLIQSFDDRWHQSNY